MNDNSTNPPPPSPVPIKNDNSQSTGETIPTFNSTDVHQPSVTLQNMEPLFGTILHHLTRQMNTEKDNKEDTEKDNKEDEDHSDEDHSDEDHSDEDHSDEDHSDEDHSDEEEYYEASDDERWEVFNKLVDSHQILCDSFNKLLKEDNE